jgi:hypothetical protein
MAIARHVLVIGVILFGQMAGGGVDVPSLPGVVRRSGNLLGGSSLSDSVSIMPYRHGRSLTRKMILSFCSRTFLFQPPSNHLKARGQP